MMRALPPLSRLLALLLLLQWGGALAQGLHRLGKVPGHGAALCLADPGAVPPLALRDFCVFCATPAELPPAPPSMMVSPVAYAVVFLPLPEAAAPPPPRRLAPPSRAPPLG